MNIKQVRRENLRLLVRELGSVTELANRLNRSQPQISHLISPNATKNIGDHLASEIEKTFNKPVGWLDYPHFERNNYKFKYLDMVPLIGWENIQDWIEDKNLHPSTHIPVAGKTHPQAFALNIENDEMTSPFGFSFPQNSIVIVNPAAALKNGAFVVADIKHNNNKPLLRQLVSKRSAIRTLSI